MTNLALHSIPSAPPHPRSQAITTMRPTTQGTSEADVLRGILATLVEAGKVDQGVELATLWVGHLETASPAPDDLRAWQLLLSDLATAIVTTTTGNAQAASHVRELADDLRRIVVVAARNPADQLVRRPIARRILGLLSANGCVELPMADIRTVIGLSQTHLSNSIRALVAHGFVEARYDTDDGRRKLLRITARGRTALAEIQAASDNMSRDRYPDRLRRADPHHKRYQPSVAIKHKRLAPA